MRIGQDANDGITVDAALDLAAQLKTSPEVWMNLQMQFDLRRAQKRRAKDASQTTLPLSAPPPSLRLILPPVNQFGIMCYMMWPAAVIAAEGLGWA